MAETPKCVWLKKLGHGSYGQVYLAREYNYDQPIAVKIIPKSKLNKRGEDNLVSEISILQNLKHPHIVRLLNFTWDSERVYLFMEYCAGGDLSHFIHTERRLPESLVRHFLRQLGLALQYLRVKNVVHMDLKPQNILLTSTSKPVLKVTDFGFAKHTDRTVQMNELRGTLLYMAPEIYVHGVYDPTCDLWSVGVILYECLFGAPPYACCDLKAFKQKMKMNEPIVIPTDVSISANCASLLRGLLQQCPSKRLTHEEFFEHPFVDLQHVPGPESLDKALHHIGLARQADKSGHMKIACTEYTRGLAHLISAVEYEKTPKVKEELKEQAMWYFARAEKIKSILKTQSPDALSAPPTTPINADGQKTASESPINSTKVPCVSNPPPRPPPPIRSAVGPETEQSVSASGLLPRLKRLFSFSDHSESPNDAQLSESSRSPSHTDRPPTGLETSTDRIASAVPDRSPTQEPNCLPSSISDTNGESRPFSSAQSVQPGNSRASSPGSAKQPAVPQSASEFGKPDSPINPDFPLSCLLAENGSAPNPITYEKDTSKSISSDSLSNDATGKIQRLRSLTGDISNRPLSISQSQVMSTYTQQMSLVTDLARLSELKSMYAESDGQYLAAVRVLEEFYTLLRTTSFQEAFVYFELHFPNCLESAKADPVKKRRSAMLNELKNVLDMIEWRKQRSSQLVAGAASTDRTPSDEVGVEITADSDEPCTIS